MLEETCWYEAAKPGLQIEDWAMDGRQHKEASMRNALMTLCLAWTATACGTGTSVSPEVPPAAVVLNAPWHDMALPIGAGDVHAESANELHIIYGDAAITRDEAGASFGSAIEKNGWQQVNVQAIGPMVAIDYAKGDAALQFIVATIGKRVDVTLEIE